MRELTAALAVCTVADAASMLAVIGVCDLVGTIGSGMLSDSFDNRWLLAVYYALRGVSLIWLVYSNVSLVANSVPRRSRGVRVGAQAGSGDRIDFASPASRSCELSMRIIYIPRRQASWR